jgi:hypothetical protein
MKVKLPKWNKKDTRKVEIHIDGHDTWSLDHTLALIILPALLQLKATKHGIPHEFVADVGGADYDSQDSFDFYKETHDESFNVACKRWDDILDKMIWSFKQLAIRDWEEKYHHGTAKYDWVKTDTQYTDPVTGKVQDSFKIFDPNPGEHWLDIEGMNKHRERIQEGLELFGKYYMHLWD